MHTHMRTRTLHMHAYFSGMNADACVRVDTPMETAQLDQCSRCPWLAGRTPKLSISRPRYGDAMLNDVHATYSTHAHIAASCCLRLRRSRMREDLGGRSLLSPLGCGKNAQARTSMHKQVAATSFAATSRTNTSRFASMQMTTLPSQTQMWARLSPSVAIVLRLMVLFGRCSGTAPAGELPSTKTRRARS